MTEPDEVRALREEVDALRDALEGFNDTEVDNDKLRAKLARVEALLRDPGKTYRKDEREPLFVYVFDVRAALKDP